ncbi:MAG: hypothetical protein ACRDNZ_11115 [Streptosporangiaceae bacterium]
MGLMEKVKAQTTVLAHKTQEAAKEGKARLDQAQASRRADVMLRNLGALVYAERTNRGGPDTVDQITRAIDAISAHEAENGINLASQSTGGAHGTGRVPSQGGPAEPKGGSAEAGPESRTESPPPFPRPPAGEDPTGNT